MDDRQLQVLERKVDELIQLCEQLDAENRTLKSETQNWKIEREALIEKTDTAFVSLSMVRSNWLAN